MVAESSFIMDEDTTRIEVNIKLDCWQIEERKRERYRKAVVASGLNVGSLPSQCIASCSWLCTLPAEDDCGNDNDQVPVAGGNK